MHLTHIMFGKQKSCVKENIKKINHTVLIAKMSISIFKKTNSKICLAIMFEQQLQITKVELTIKNAFRRKVWFVSIIRHRHTHEDTQASTYTHTRTPHTHPTPNLHNDINLKEYFTEWMQLGGTSQVFC